MARSKETPNVIVEDAQIAFRNFAGKEGQYNRAGDRNFCLLLSEKMRGDLERDGWNVKFLKPREEGDEPRAYIQVAVSFKNIPPRITMITGQGKTLMDEDNIAVLDFAEIENIDLIVRPYHWEVNGNEGIKAYVKTMYVTLREDEFASKYYDVPDSAVAGMTREPDWED